MCAKSCVSRTCSPDLLSADTLSPSVHIWARWCSGQRLSPTQTWTFFSLFSLLLAPTCKKLLSWPGCSSSSALQHHYLSWFSIFLPQFYSFSSSTSWLCSLIKGFLPPEKHVRSAAAFQVKLNSIWSDFCQIIWLKHCVDSIEQANKCSTVSLLSFQNILSHLPVKNNQFEMSITYMYNSILQCFTQFL